jgi:hypothetical protein
VTQSAGLVPRRDGVDEPVCLAGTMRRPDARFVTQLLAARAQLAQQRAKRRAAPEGGAAAYRASVSVADAARRSLDRAL